MRGIGDVLHIFTFMEYNSNLDFWDGNNYTSGATGRHLGLAKLGDDYVLIQGTQWQGERDSAELVSARRAVQEILKSGNTELFEEYPDLQVIRETMGNKEKAVVIMNVDAGLKKRWQGRAELENLSLTGLIKKAMAEHLQKNKLIAPA